MGVAVVTFYNAAAQPKVSQVASIKLCTKYSHYIAVLQVRRAAGFFFYYFQENICSDTSLEPSHSDGSNEGSQYMFVTYH